MAFNETNYRRLRARLEASDDFNWMDPTVCVAACAARQNMANIPAVGWLLAKLPVIANGSSIEKLLGCTRSQANRMTTPAAAYNFLKRYPFPSNNDKSAALECLDALASLHGVDLKAEAAKAQTESATQVRSGGVGTGHPDAATLGTQEDGHACGLPVQRHCDSFQPDEAAFLAAVRCEHFPKESVR